MKHRREQQAKQKVNGFFADRSKKVPAIIAAVFILASVGLAMENSSSGERIETLQAENENLKSMYKSAQEKADGQSDQSQQLAYAQERCAELESQLSELQSKYDALEQAVAQASAQASAQPSEEAQPSKSSVSSSSSSSSSSYKPKEPSGTVYWTSGGSKYHSTKNCVSLKRSKSIQSGSVSEAKSAGKSSPCKNCN